MSLVARVAETSGVPTLVIGSALDIVVEVGVARFLFVDYPLGNPCGRPHDLGDQRSILELALDVAVTAIAPRTLVQAPTTWPQDSWRATYMHVGDDNRTSLAEAGERRRARQAVERKAGH